MSEKRKRASNFTEEEKLRFLRLLQAKGQVIISKVTSHDSRTNRLKEEAWVKICDDLNSSGSELRTKDTLKKLWQKLKSDAKTHKSAHHQIRGRGGGPSRKLDPVLDLVAGITGRGTSGIEGVSDCDSDIISTLDIKTLIEEPAQKEIFHPDFEINSNEKPNKSSSSTLKRRSPQLTQNERAGPSEATLLFAAERLKAEKAKTELMLLKLKQETEYHDLKMANEQKLFVLKENLLKVIKEKIQGTSELNADILHIAMNQIKE